MLLRQFEMPWRTTYEAHAAVGWIACLVTMGILYHTATVPKMPLLFLGVLAVGFFMVNAIRAWELWRLKFNLSGKGISYITDDELEKKVYLQLSLGQRMNRFFGKKIEPDSLWVGRGFDWTPVHTQRVYEIKRADPEQFYPPKIIMKLTEILTGEKVGANMPELIGAPWIHGVNVDEENLYVPIQNWVGNTLLLGTTRCGKTRFLELIAEMAILLGYCVIVIDPKGDQAFEISIKAACNHAGRDGDYARIHLAFPNESIRIDPLKNYTNRSDLASRISALMPGGDNSSSFRDFAWNVLNAIVLGMIDIGEKPSLVKIRQYVDNGVADLLARVTLRYYDEALPANWEMDVSNYARTIKQGKGKSEEGELLIRQSLNLLLSYYLDVLVPRGFNNEAVQALTTIYKHDSAHYTKMIANLIPILGMLTTGELGPLLSPDHRDVSDTRPMSDLQALIRSNAVVYIGLNSLANKSISTAVGAMLLSDATSVAAAIYNYADQGWTAQKVFLIVDEASEVVNEPYIQILNKSSGANFINIAAAQTVPDFAARFESMDKARQMLGNFNNLFAMRIKDRVTQDYVIETFGETYVYSKQVIMGTTSSTEKNITHFTGSMQERVTETLDDIFPPDLLGEMPNWQYIGSVSGGRIIKGRLDIIQH